ncbi:nuclear transport factor 2 family protein [Rhodococcus sp. WS4]|nr:nuclear transport factor 2 family protein [Rhodococcus sp. WS4]
MTSNGPTETETNRALAQSMYQAVLGGDTERFLAFVSPEVVVEEPEFLSYGGKYQGFAGFQELFATLASKFDLAGMTVDRLVVDGDYVCAFGRVPILGGDDLVSFAERSIFENGKVTNFRVYLYDTGDLGVGRDPEKLVL